MLTVLQTCKHVKASVILVDLCFCYVILVDLVFAYLTVYFLVDVSLSVFSCRLISKQTHDDDDDDDDGINSRSHSVCRVNVCRCFIDQSSSVDEKGRHSDAQATTKRSKTTVEWLVNLLPLLLPPMGPIRSVSGDLIRSWDPD